MMFPSNKNLLELIKIYEALNEITINYNFISYDTVTNQELIFESFNQIEHIDLNKELYEFLNLNSNHNLCRRLHSVIKTHIQNYLNEEQNFDSYKIIETIKNKYFDHKFRLIESERETIKNFKYKYEIERTILLNENSEESTTLKNKFNNITECFAKNYALKLLKLSKKFIDILQDYFPNLKKLPFDDKYLNKELLFFLHSICDDFIFEKTNKNNYITFFNLSIKKNPLIRKPKTEIYICYLLNFLSNYIIKEDRNTWLNQYLQFFEINRKETYEKKKNQLKTEQKAEQSKASKFLRKLEILEELIPHRAS